MLTGEYIAIGTFGVVIIGMVGGMTFKMSRGVETRIKTSEDESNDVFVKKEVCSVVHTNVNKTLERIEKSVNEILKNGAK